MCRCRRSRQQQRKIVYCSHFSVSLIPILWRSTWILLLFRASVRERMCMDIVLCSIAARSPYFLFLLSATPSVFVSLFHRTLQHIQLVSSARSILAWLHSHWYVKHKRTHTNTDKHSRMILGRCLGVLARAFPSSSFYISKMWAPLIIITLKEMRSTV